MFRSQVESSTARRLGNDDWAINDRLSTEEARHLRRGGAKDQRSTTLPRVADRGNAHHNVHQPTVRQMLRNTASFGFADLLAATELDHEFWVTARTRHELLLRKLRESIGDEAQPVDAKLLLRILGEVKKTLGCGTTRTHVCSTSAGGDVGY